MVTLENKLWSQFSNEIKASIKVLSDAVPTFRAVWIPAGVAHQARQIHEVAKVQSRIPRADPPPLHFQRSFASLCVRKMSVAA
jgi:hypothetical protein